ncbi:MAG: histidine phosphatase family protein [Candidatus Tectomicrobia bacterium]|nr:histidine phosphatase family protein [Candidatus Tectomicrobia bacterium]
MPRLLYIVRHGATDWNQSKCLQGQLDTPLNDDGRSQAALAGKRLASSGATALYSSDLLRAYETAQFIARAASLHIIQKPGLREMHFGAWQGLTVDQIRERDPELYAARRERPYDVPPPGGEVWRQFYQRSVKSIHDILHATNAERVIVATHSGVCTVLGLEALGLGYAGKRTFSNANCGIHTIAVEDDRWEALSLNDVSHLEEVPPATTP